MKEGTRQEAVAEDAPAAASTEKARPARVYPILGLGLVSFAFSPILVRLAGEAPGLTVAVWRTVLAAAMVLPIGLWRARGEIRGLTGREWGLIVGAGVLLSVHFVTWIESLYHTSVASASVLVTTSPIFLAVLGYFILKERVSRRVALAIAVAVGGAILLALGDAGDADVPNALWGNALALTASLLVSLYLLVGRVVRQDRSWLGYVVPLYTVVALVTVAIGLARGAPLFGFSPTFYVLCALMALGPQLFGHGSLNYALRYFSAALLGLLTLLEPVGASVAAYFLFDEQPGGLSLAGLVIVLLAVAYALRPVKRSG